MEITKTFNVGRFVVNLNEADVVIIPSDVRRRLEAIANKFPTISKIVRFDMAPWDGEGTPPIYEIETAPGGLMFNFPGFPWGKLHQIADTAVCLDPEWLPAYHRLQELVGWNVVSWWTTPGKLFFSGNFDDVPPEVSIVTDPWCSKANMISITGGEIVGADTSKNFGVLNSKYPEGFVVKPVWGWGSADIHMYPRRSPFSNYGRPKSEMRDVIRTAQANCKQWMIQPFFAPEQISIWHEFRIWRVYAVRIGGNFELLGGTWNCRPTIKVHGASDNLVGEVRV